jgi:hypothetical protein
MTDDRLDPVGGKRRKYAHIFAPAENKFYLEPHWCSRRLFAVEKFPGPVWDPFCGTGRVVEAALAFGYTTWATDIVDRGYERLNKLKDFLTVNHVRDDLSIVGNPPFDDRILQHAIGLNPIKMALIWPLARLVAAHEWLHSAPLARVLMMTPRPSMPPGSYIASGKKPQGARVEHCWLVFERAYRGQPRLGWLRRDFDIATQHDGAAA